MSKKPYLERIRRLIEMRAPDDAVEKSIMSYLKAEHGSGICLVLWLINLTVANWYEKKTFSLSYLWKVSIRKQSDRAFFANRVGMTEAEIDLVEKEV